MNYLIQDEGRRLHEELMSLIDTIGYKNMHMDNFKTEVLQCVGKVIGVDAKSQQEERESQIMNNIRNTFDSRLNCTENSDEEPEECNGFVDLSTLVDQRIQDFLHISDQKKYKLQMKMERRRNKEIANENNMSSNSSYEEDPELESAKRRVYKMTVKKMRDVIKNLNIPIKKRFFLSLFPPFLTLLTT